MIIAKSLEEYWGIEVSDKITMVRVALWWTRSCCGLKAFMEEKLCLSSRLLILFQLNNMLQMCSNWIICFKCAAYRPGARRLLIAKFENAFWPLGVIREGLTNRKPLGLIVTGCANSSGRVKCVANKILFAKFENGWFLVWEVALGPPITKI